MKYNIRCKYVLDSRLSNSSVIVHNLFTTTIIYHISNLKNKLFYANDIIIYKTFTERSFNNREN